MQTVTFPCPFCGRRMGVGQDLLGRHVRCPHCRQVVQAPATNPAAPAPAAPPAAPGYSGPQPPPAPTYTPAPVPAPAPAFVPAPASPPPAPLPQDVVMPPAASRPPGSFVEPPAEAPPAPPYQPPAAYQPAPAYPPPPAGPVPGPGPEFSFPPRKEAADSILGDPEESEDEVFGSSVKGHAGLPSLPPTDPPAAPAGGPPDDDLFGFMSRPQPQPDAAPQPGPAPEPFPPQVEPATSPTLPVGISPPPPPAAVEPPTPAANPFAAIEPPAPPSQAVAHDAAGPMSGFDPNPFGPPPTQAPAAPAYTPAAAAPAYTPVAAPPAYTPVAPPPPPPPAAPANPWGNAAPPSQPPTPGPTVPSNPWAALDAMVAPNANLPASAAPAFQPTPAAPAFQPAPAYQPPPAPAYQPAPAPAYQPPPAATAPPAPPTPSVESPPEPAATARPRGRQPAASGGTGVMKIALGFVALWALAATAAAAYGLLFRGAGDDPGHPMSNVPDTLGEYPPAERKKTSQYKFNLDRDLPESLRVQVGQKLPVGQLLVEPVAVELKKVDEFTEMEGGKSAAARSTLPYPALVMKLNITNTSDDVTFCPTDPAFNRRQSRNEAAPESIGTRLTVGKLTQIGGSTEWPFARAQGRTRRVYADGQQDDPKPLKPKETREYVIVSRQDKALADAVKKADDVLLWKVQLRRGLTRYNGRDVPTTAVVGVEIKPDEVAVIN